MKSKEFYKSRAWFWFSRYMKLKHATKDHVIKCYTSGRFYTLPDRRVHLGHYIKVYDSNSTHFSTAFDERNVLPQSYADNVYSSGKPDVMRRELIRIWGEDEIEKLELRSRNICKLSSFELSVIEKEYKEKFKILTVTKGNPWK